MRVILSVLTILMAAMTARADDAPYRTLTWDDLMPAGEWERINQQMHDFFEGQAGGMIIEGGALDVARQFGTYNVVTELNDQKVRLPGFVLPFEYAAGKKVSEFLLVPYFGACLHTPPPPPNQIVYVITAEPIAVESLWQPIWAHGSLVTQRHLNGLGDAAYTLQLEQWEPYQWED
ncbi:MAG: DUF3299 domain-containing protein [Sphingomonadales bacterium]|nr:DUF3299 domain-containing protein [Sphingomonadales bacterium]